MKSIAANEHLKHRGHRTIQSNESLSINCNRGDWNRNSFIRICMCIYNNYCYYLAHVDNWIESFVKNKQKQKSQQRMETKLIKSTVLCLKMKITTTKKKFKKWKKKYT